MLKCTCVARIQAHEILSHMSRKMGVKIYVSMCGGRRREDENHEATEKLSRASNFNGRTTLKNYVTRLHT